MLVVCYLVTCYVGFVIWLSVWVVWFCVCCSLLLRLALGGIVLLVYWCDVCGFVLCHLCVVFAVVFRLLFVALGVVGLMRLLFTGYMFGLIVCGLLCFACFVGLDCVLLLVRSDALLVWLLVYCALF